MLTIREQYIQPETFESNMRTKTQEKMPEVFRKLGFVFFFYSNEGSEPIHIHVRKAGGFAKFWVEPIELDYAQGMKIQDLKNAEDLISENKDLIIMKWNEIHGS